MEISSSFIKDSVIRISGIKASLLRDMPFYGILLGNFKFSLDDSVSTVYTDGERIAFNPEFLALIDDESLKFILLHEILHMALNHRAVRDDYDPELFDLASDIVVNSNILYSFSFDESKISISIPHKYQEKYREILGIAPHKLPTGEEGYKYTAEYVYSVLKKKMDDESDDEYDDEYSDDYESDAFDGGDDFFSDDDSSISMDDGDMENGEDLGSKLSDNDDSIDKEKYEEYSEESNEEESSDDKEKHSDKSQDSRNKKKPSLSSKDKSGSKANPESGSDEEKEGEEEGFSLNGNESEKEDNKKQGNTSQNESQKNGGKNTDDSKNKKDDLDSFDADRESDEGEESSLDVKASNKEGDKKQENEEKNKSQKKSDNDADAKGNKGNSKDQNGGGGKQSLSQKGEKGGSVSKGNLRFGKKVNNVPSNKKRKSSLGKTNLHTRYIHEVKKKRFDYHDKWKKDEDIGRTLKREYERKRSMKTALSLTPTKSRGLIPLGALLKIEMEEKETKLDWKNLLHDFLSIDEKDYSFTPPDKRYDSSPFFLPDFNLEGMKIKNILVFVDTSGSMSYLIVKEILEEIKAAISDSECGLKGWLGFFDAGVTEPVPINEECDMNDISVHGGGGTSFQAVFEYIKDVMRPDKESQNEEIAAIVMITDGFCPFPDESITEGIPVLWIMTTSLEAPWGKTVHFYS